MHSSCSRDERGSGAPLVFPSPLIKPDVRISRIRLSDWLHREAHGGGPKWSRKWKISSAANTASCGKWLVLREGTL